MTPPGSIKVRQRLILAALATLAALAAFATASACDYSAEGTVKNWHWKFIRDSDLDEIILDISLTEYADSFFCDDPARLSYVKWVSTGGLKKNLPLATEILKGNEEAEKLYCMEIS